MLQYEKTYGIGWVASGKNRDGEWRWMEPFTRVTASTVAYYSVMISYLCQSICRITEYPCCEKE